MKEKTTLPGFNADVLLGASTQYFIALSSKSNEQKFGILPAAAPWDVNFRCYNKRGERCPIVCYLDFCYCDCAVLGFGLGRNLFMANS